MEVIRKSPAVTRVSFDTEIRQPYYYQPFLLLSDVHYDSPYNQTKLLKKHLDQAKQSGAIIFIFGDWFDIMGTHGDPRSKANEISSRYLSRDFSYLDMVIEDSADFLRPYAKNIALIGDGNHETKIKQKHDTDPLKRLINLLEEENPAIQHAGYSGFLELNEILQTGNSSVNSLSTIHFHHGFGGSAPRSKGTLNVDLEAMQYPGVDFLVRGHIHQKWLMESSVQITVTKAGSIKKRGVTYIQLSSYLDSYDQGQGGFAIEKNLRPAAPGGYWLNLYRSGRREQEWQVVSAS